MAALARRAREFPSDAEAIEKLFGEQYKGKERLLESNVRALQSGRSFAREHLMPPAGAGWNGPSAYRTARNHANRTPFAWRRPRRSGPLEGRGRPLPPYFPAIERQSLDSGLQDKIA